MEKLRGSIYLIGGFTLAGTSVVAARCVAQSLGTFTITAVSLFFAAVGLLPLCKGRLGEAFRQLQPRDWLALLIQATCGIFLFRMFLIQGLMRTSAGEAGILTGATPAITAILAMVLLKEQSSSGGLLGIVSTVAGIVLLQGLFLPSDGFSQEHFIGNMLVLCAALCEALFNVFSRINALRARPAAMGPDPVVQTCLVSIIALLLCLVPAALEHPLPALRSLGIAEWLALVWYGWFVTALAFVLFYAGIKRCRASAAAVFSGMMPFTALLLSVVLLGERAGWQQWLGGAMIVLGMILLGSQEAQPERPAHDILSSA